MQANNTSPTLTFNESAKTNTQVTGSNLLMGTPAAQTAYNSYLRLKMVTDTLNYGDMVVGFNTASTTAYNPAQDDRFFPSAGAAQSISAISSDSVNNAVKWVPFPKNASAQVIKLNVWAKASGQYTLQRTDLQAVPAIYTVWLMDKNQKDSLDIRHNSTYVFNIDLSDTSTYGDNRFSIVVRQDPAMAVHLLSFSAVKVQAGSQIAWTTENEANYTSFTVQRSIDGGATFTILGGVPSGGQGTYTFLDNHPVTGPNTYRLMIQDLNGVISYSNSVTLMYGNANASAGSNISVYPNPATSVINLSISQQNNAGTPILIASGQSAIQGLALTPMLAASPVVASAFYIRIIDITGSVVKESTSSSSNWQSDVSSLSPGTYIIQVTDKGKGSMVGRGLFVKM